MSLLEDLSFPIGPYERPAEITKDHLLDWINSIKTFPERLSKMTAWLTSTQLDTPYRPGGWTVRQLVHHLADSHMNAYLRLKLGLTENKPHIKPYDQDAWAQLPDSNLPVEVSLQLLTALHQRWIEVLQQVKDWKRTVYHPELEATLALDDLLSQYAWHGEHHLAHITALIEREGW